MAYHAKSQKTYNDKCVRKAVKYLPSEKVEIDRLERYLNENDLSFNAYAKKLIKNDLDNKGISYPVINTEESTEVK